MIEVIKNNPEMAILFVLFLIGFIFFSKTLINNFKRLLEQLQNSKEYNKKMKEVDEMKANGDLHEWISLPVRLNGQEAYVCRKTGFCPTIEGFVPMSYIQLWESRQKQLEEWEIFRQRKMEDLVQKHNLPIQKLEELSDDIYAIKRDFKVSEMERGIKEILSIVERSEQDEKK